MKTSTARSNDWHCPKCGDATSVDYSGVGFVRHKTNRDCQFERGQRDGDIAAHNPNYARISPNVEIPTDGVNLLGYSERGVINSLFYEICYTPDAMGLLSQFLSRIRPHLPFQCQIRRAVVLIEQSFSDFGDADAVLLIDNGSEGASTKIAIFLEAKVKTWDKNWYIQSEWQHFKGLLAGSLSDSKMKYPSSNLFTQLYYKVRLVAALNCANGLQELKKGIRFPKPFEKKGSNSGNRRIGKNGVVLEAVNLLHPYVAQAYFVMLVPDKPPNAKQFFSNDLKSLQGPEGWDVSSWHYLCWSEVEDFCNSVGLEKTASIFGFNQGQIYRDC